MNISRLCHISLSAILTMTVVGCANSSGTPSFSSGFSGAGTTQTLTGLPTQLALSASGLTGTIGIPAPVTTDAGVTVGASISASPPASLGAPTTPAGATLIGFISLGFSQSVTLVAPLSLSSSLGTSTPPVSVFAYTYSAGAWVPAAFNPPTISGTSPLVATFVPTAVPTTYSAGTTYAYAIFRQ